LLGRDCTEVSALWQVPANEAISVLIRAPLPGCIGASKVASDSQSGRERLVFGILGTVVQCEGLASLGRKLLEPIDDCLIRLVSALSGQLGDQDKPALAFDQGVECYFALSGDETVSLPVTVLATTLNGLRSGVNRNPVGNRGFSHFSADALVLPLLVGSAQQLDHLQTIWILGMIDVLIDGLVVDGFSRMVKPDPPRDLLRGPSFSETGLYILPNKVVFQTLVLVGLCLSLAGPSVCPTGNITPPLWRRVTIEFTRDCAFVSAYSICNIAEAGTS